MPLLAAGRHRQVRPTPQQSPASEIAAAAAVDLALGVLQRRLCIQVRRISHLVLRIIPFPSSPFPFLLGFGRRTAAAALRLRRALHQAFFRPFAIDEHTPSMPTASLPFVAVRNQAPKP